MDEFFSIKTKKKRVPFNNNILKSKDLYIKHMHFENHFSRLKLRQ